MGVNFARRAADADATVAEIRANGGTAIPLQADIADRGQVLAMVDTISRELGPPHILVNNAAILRLGELDDWDVREMDVMRRTNVDGVVHTIQAVLPGMKAQSSDALSISLPLRRTERLWRETRSTLPRKARSTY